MKTSLLTVLASVLAVSAIASPKEDALTASAKLAEASSYTWTAKTSVAGSQFTPPTVTGKAEKGGFAVLTQEREGSVSIAVLKGDKGVLKTDSGWQTAEELRAAAQERGNAGGGGRGGAGMRGQLLRTPLPGAEAAKLASKAVEWKSADGAVVGDLSVEGAKELLTLNRGGRAGGGQAPEVKNAKASVHYWIQGGAIAKMQVNVSGTIVGRNGDRETSRSTTYEFKDVGSTKVEVPEEAKKKLGA